MVLPAVLGIIRRLLPRPIIRLIMCIIPCAHASPAASDLERLFEDPGFEIMTFVENRSQNLTLISSARRDGLRGARRERGHPQALETSN